MTIKSFLLISSLTIVSVCHIAVGAEQQFGRVIAGWVERVHIENLTFEVKAKLDTGAKTSSIHAVDIVPFKRDGQHWAKFTLVLRDSSGKQHKMPMEKPRARKAKIKNHDGDHDSRYVVNLDICFNGRRHSAEFTLADRNEYIYDILLGRRFLKHVAVIDPSATYITLTACDAS